MEILCNLLELQPKPQWLEVLRLYALPQVPEKLTLADPQEWKATRKALEETRANPDECEAAASQLLLDTWLWATSAYEKPEESPFAELAALTRSSRFPALQIAHCIRDSAHGDKARIADLTTMVKSEDPEYRKIFERACWR